VLRSPALRWLTAATALTNVGGNVMLSYIAPIVKAVQGITGPALAALLFTQGIGGLLGNLLSVRLIRRIGPTGVAYKCNGNVGSRAAALAVRCELDRRDLRRAVRMEPRQCRVPSRAASAAGCGCAAACSGDDRDELVDDVSGRRDRRHDRRAGVDGGRAAIHAVGRIRVRGRGARVLDDGRAGGDAGKESG
jgi:hypothetical protein